MGGRERSLEAVVPATAVAVIASITALAWGLSYTALRSLAARHGWPEDGPLGWPASAWPLVIDLFMLAAALVAVEAKRRGDQDVYAWTLTVTYSGALVAGNVLPVWPDPVGVAMHAAPGVTLIAGWHVLLRRLGRSVGEVDANERPHTVDLPAIPVDPLAPAGADKVNRRRNRSPVRHTRKEQRFEPPPLADVRTALLALADENGREPAQIEAGDVAERFGLPRSHSTIRRRVSEVKASFERPVLEALR